MRTSIYQVRQGTPLWQQLRGVRFTATKWGDILGLNGVAGQRAQIEQLYERMHSRSVPYTHLTGDAIIWGNTFEDTALDAYDRLYDTQTTFRNNTFAVVDGADYLGASPDAYDNDILIEIKCPYTGAIPAQRHLQYWLQTQIQMICTGYKRARLVYWRPLPVQLEEFVTVPVLNMGDWLHVTEFKAHEGVKAAIVDIGKALFDEITHGSVPPDAMSTRVCAQMRSKMRRCMDESIVGVETKMSPGTIFHDSPLAAAHVNMERQPVQRNSFFES